ncbi:hypothetical protein BJY00DRAFT_287789 [Aspergillus carlsbadensis]|nr:hypothetical protein BJY00DRAFT_287789 [Aspergillus carlsbadensis]
MRVFPMPTRTNRIPVAVRIRVTVVVASALRAIVVPRCAPVLVVAIAVQAGFRGWCGGHGALFFLLWLARVG